MVGKHLCFKCFWVLCIFMNIYLIELWDMINFIRYFSYVFSNDQRCFLKLNLKPFTTLRYFDSIRTLPFIIEVICSLMMNAYIVKSWSLYWMVVLLGSTHYWMGINRRLIFNHGMLEKLLAFKWMDYRSYWSSNQVTSKYKESCAIKQIVLTVFFFFWREGVGMVLVVNFHLVVVT